MAGVEVDIKMGTANKLADAIHGCRLVLSIIDEIAHSEPRRKVFRIPCLNQSIDGWSVINTFRDYANAVNLRAVRDSIRRRVSDARLYRPARCEISRVSGSCSGGWVQGE